MKPWGTIDDVPDPYDWENPPDQIVDGLICSIKFAMSTGKYSDNDIAEAMIDECRARKEPMIV